eukprot:gene3701-6590_t
MNRITKNLTLNKKQFYSTKTNNIQARGVWTTGLYVSQSVWYDKELSEEEKKLEENSTLFKATKTRFIRLWNEELKFVSQRFNEEIKIKNEREKYILKNHLNEEIKIEVGENTKIKNISTK